MTEFMRYLLILGMLGSLLACAPRVERWFAGPEDVEYRGALGEEVVPRDAAARPRGVDPCNDGAHYIPDTNALSQTPIKYIRLNFHFVNSLDGAHNFDEREGRRRVRELITSANHDLANNAKMNLPAGNDTPVLPTRYRYALTPRPDDPDDDGIYFHYDDELFAYVHRGKNRNLFERRVIDRYGVQLDTVLNVFLMTHHPDSIRSPTYKPGAVGVALGNALKVAGLYSSGQPGWAIRGVFNHEVGHILGLMHTWAYNDGCIDTPRNPNCWSQTGRSPCEGPVSNNLMDYNATQNAWTPCQIGRIHARLSREDGRARRFLRPEWCTLHEDRGVVIRDSVVWRGAKDLEGHLLVEDGGVLTVRCRVSLPPGARITVQPGGTLILDGARLHNACGEQWQGIELVRRGERRSEVVFIGDAVVEDAVNGM